MTGFTPGPWIAIEGSDGEWCVLSEYTEISEGWLVAVVDHVDQERMPANAALIASAPALLAALEAMVALKGGWREAIFELEDFCFEPVRLKNMIAAGGQLDEWARNARRVIRQAKGEG